MVTIPQSKDHLQRVFLEVSWTAEEGSPQLFRLALPKCFENTTFENRSSFSKASQGDTRSGPVTSSIRDSAYDKEFELVGLYKHVSFR
ncbi:hypothetical protein Y032_0684g1508 [Ancylostoma ceylanicum]|nr:hypothetical protein Y032_0684g1508 [Ancylostoma ceylanicum]